MIIFYVDRHIAREVKVVKTDNVTTLTKCRKTQNNEQIVHHYLLFLKTPSTLPGLPQHLSLPPQSHQPLTPSQLPWLAQLAASSCGEGVVVLGEHIGSLAQGIQQTFSRLMEGRLDNTNYVVIIVTVPGQETQSCVVVTGRIQYQFGR